MDILQENIHDNRFLRLIESTLKHGNCKELNYSQLSCIYSCGQKET